MDTVRHTNKNFFLRVVKGTFSDKQKLKESFASKSAVKKVLEFVLQDEEKYTQMKRKGQTTLERGIVCINRRQYLFFSYNFFKRQQPYRHSFMIENLSRLYIDDNFLNLIKDFYETWRLTPYLFSKRK